MRMGDIGSEKQSPPVRAPARNFLKFMPSLLPPSCPCPRPNSAPRPFFRP